MLAWYNLNDQCNNKLTQLIWVEVYNILEICSLLCATQTCKKKHLRPLNPNVIQSWQNNLKKLLFLRRKKEGSTLFAHQSLLAEQILPVHLRHLAGEIWHSSKAEDTAFIMSYFITIFHVIAALIKLERRYIFLVFDLKIKLKEQIHILFF